MWYYVLTIKFKYYERKKARHIAIPLCYYYDCHVFPSIYIIFFQKSHFTIRYTDPKKENFTDLLHRAYLAIIFILRTVTLV